MTFNRRQLMGVNEIYFHIENDLNVAVIAVV